LDSKSLRRPRNLKAIDFLRRMNEAVYARGNGTFTVAEESTAWPIVSRPTYIGGLGFGYKWNMGWMHDTLLYMSKDPVHRKHHHGIPPPSDFFMPSPKISFCHCPRRGRPRQGLAAGQDAR